MADQPQPPPSFTPFRRWSIGFNLLLRTALVLAVVVMVNYLSSEYFNRFYLSSQTRIQLSSRTLNVLQALTNQVTVTLYYDRTDEFYPTILSLLNEYRTANPKIKVRTVDFVRDPGEAEKVKQQYKLSGDKDLVIFDLNGRLEIVEGDRLARMLIKKIAKNEAGETEFIQKPVSFSGEMVFTADLLALENPQPLKAYFLQGHGEPSLASAEQKRGYLTFGSVLQQNYLSVATLELFGDHPIPDDCNLLIIAAPTQALEAPELQKIDQYLTQGGRLLVLLDFLSIPTASHPRSSGLEPILQRWGIDVGFDEVKDPDNTITTQDIKVQDFGRHPIVSQLAQRSMHLILPRPVSKVIWQNPPANAPDVQELAFSGPGSTLSNDNSEPPHKYPLIVAAEQKTVAGVNNPHGSTRIVAVGDSFFLGNYYIQEDGNRDFLDSSVNWLLDRSSLVSSIAPQNIIEYRLTMTQQQQRESRWILLGALPGIVLLIGGFIWLVRRK